MRRRLNRLHRDDRGFTMIELVVTMVVMGIVIVIFGSGISQVFGVEEKVDSANVADSNLTIAFQRLDTQLRYAAGISIPGTMGGNPVVEFVTAFTGTNVCTELRLNVSAGQLQERTWTQSSATNPPTPTPTALSPLASGIGLVAGTTTPFTRLAPDANFNFQRLQVQLAASFGSTATGTTKSSNITFTALNTTLTTSSDSVCIEGRNATWP